MISFQMRAYCVTRVWLERGLFLEKIVFLMLLKSLRDFVTNNIIVHVRGSKLMLSANASRKLSANENRVMITTGK